MKALLVFHLKQILPHMTREDEALVEISVYKIPQSESYPEGVKYAMFLVLKNSGQVLIGFDNHHPKGPHIHLHDVEHEYDFIDFDAAFLDFKHLVRLEGYTI
jgi:hypothetical protein